jgi:hypothetical protein
MMTITEALAELKTLQKRIEKKRESVGQYIGRQEGLRDPLEKEGGSAAFITRERQAIKDLDARRVLIRTSIQKINQVTPITIGETTKMIAEWLTWRKEIAQGEKAFLDKIRQTVLTARAQAQQKGWGVVSATAISGDIKPTDLIINVDEALLAKEAEEYENIIGTLDGQLSLKNATVMVEV